ncbi:SpoIIE family protein phosphatase [Paenibacillus radicis (ex Xue et al. 2023)]|uniref:SpoIIE family protein phosphatase n=1 Tax=Paenibacillus radicis (ex Xue et al. 2023) TaxID=2972489 RepID=A0ABT1Y9D1_9BACL|nr:SpoIIE family protein phosphatase [Paenibacillus radicis (ex Xue et al. 2023)]MCR8629800.1 SpoIIE family protein phosphatase [Paenibacillus radicis (ex Xue et al. 2023)]
MEIKLKSIRQDQGVFKVVIFASLVIIISILLVGSIVYFITAKEAVKKLKEKDLAFMVRSIASNVDGRIERAKETSSLLAQDPGINRWVRSEEKDEQAGKDAVERIQKLAKEFDYNNTFIVSAITKHYWGENGSIIGTLQESNPDDQWFFKTLAAKQQVNVQLDFNAQRQDTFVFVNVLMGDVNNPIAVAGVGMSLKSMSEEFTNYKYGKNSNLWMVDGTGKIHLSDKLEHDGQMLDAFLPSTVKTIVMTAGQKESKSDFQPQILEYTNDKGELIDLISYPLESSANWRIVYQIPRSETVGFLSTIKVNTAAAALMSIIAIIFIFYYVSTRLANPFKRALQLNEELESKVTERTRELWEQKEKLVDSIDYAKRIQEAILPPKERLNKLWNEHFLIWNPRDTVGGDFYWVKSFDSGYLVAVGDCTGHGVPGAFMTMVSVSILNQITNESNKENPAQILQRLNQLIKQTLQQEQGRSRTDDGLDLGLCYVSNEGNLIFAGAKSTLYVSDGQELKIFKGDRKSIGYNKTDNSYLFTNIVVEANKSASVYMISDGFIDQNGGPQNYSFGRQRFVQMLQEGMNMPLSEQEPYFRGMLEAYRNGEPQRDDITLLAFKVG